jgi:hypothetical protein
MYSCFRFAKMCSCQVSLLLRRNPRYLTSSSWGSCTLFVWTGGLASLRVVNVTWTNLDPLAFIFHFYNQFWIAARLVCSFCEAMAGSLPMASTAVYSRYNNGLRSLTWGVPTLTGVSSVYSVSTIMRKTQ